MAAKLESRINKLEGKIMSPKIPNLVIRFVSVTGKGDGGLYRYDGDHLVRIKEQSEHCD